MFNHNKTNFYANIKLNIEKNLCGISARIEQFLLDNSSRMKLLFLGISAGMEYFYEVIGWDGTVQNSSLICRLFCPGRVTSQRQFRPGQNTLWPVLAKIHHRHLSRLSPDPKFQIWTLAFNIYPISKVKHML